MNLHKLLRRARCTALALEMVRRYRAEAPAGCDPVNIEGWAAASVAVAAVGVGASYYSSSQNASAQQAQAAALAKQPNVVPANFEDPSKAFDEYYTQVQNQYPKLAQISDTLNTTDNAEYRKQVSTASPNLMAGISTQGTVANELLHGNIPKDVQAQVERSSAYQSLSGGYGASSGAGRALTARDFGETSLNLINQGSSLLGANVANTKAVTPYNFTADSLMLTPQQELSRDDSNAAYANGVLNRNNQIQYQNGIYGAAANSYNPTAAGVMSGVGASGGLVNSLKGMYQSYGNNGSGSQYPDNYDAATSAATSNGVYNPYLDTNNYDASGAFIGNANSYG